MSRHIVAIVCAVGFAMGASVSAQSGKITFMKPPTQRVKFDEPLKVASGNGKTKVIGSVIDIRQVPVKHVKLQLRSLATGKVEKIVESDDNGEYEFDIDDSGTYVVEMVMVDGRVIALSNAGTLARYETMHTVVQLPGRWDLQSSQMVMQTAAGNYFGMSAQTTMAAATLSMAIEARISPTDAGEPVSASAPTGPK